MAGSKGIRNDIVRNERYRHYVEGNVVRKEAYPELPERRQEKHINRRRRELEQVSMSAPYVLFLVIAAVAAVCMCIIYLNIQSEITKTRSHISSLRSSVGTVMSQNDSMDYEINGFMDLEYIYRVATEELGMVPAAKDQISLYDQTEKEYMKQFNDIP